MKKIVLILLLIIFTGCLDIEFDPFPKTIVFTIHIEKGGQGSIKMDWIDIKSSKEGQEGIESVKSFIESFEAEEVSDSYDFFQGCTDFNKCIGYDSNGTLNACIEGYFPDIFIMLKNLVSEKLAKDNSFSCKWDGDVLSVEIEDKIKISPEKEDISYNESLNCQVVFITEGEFIKATHGQISDDKKKLIIEDSVMLESFGFSIKGLAIE